MVLTVSFVLSPVNGLCCHRRLAGFPARLDASVAASGPHDFAVRFSSAFVSRAKSVHRIPRSTFVTIAKRPFGEAGRSESIKLLLAGREAKCFCLRGWTDRQISDLAALSVFPNRLLETCPTG
jgi:hypothetical protein